MNIKEINILNVKVINKSINKKYLFKHFFQPYSFSVNSQTQTTHQQLNAVCIRT